MASGSRGRSRVTRTVDLSARIRPSEFSAFGREIAVRCPAELALLLRQAGATWEPGGRRWLVQR
jgi:hypothetical protein